MFRKLFLPISLVLVGAGIGVLVLYACSRLLPFNSPVLSVFGIKKPEIIGFLPYWLLDKADKKYGNYITTLTYFGLALDSDGKPIYLAAPGEEEPGWTALKGTTWEKQASAMKRGELSLLVHSADEQTIAGLLEDPVTHAHNLVGEVGPIMMKRKFTDLNLDIESFAEATSGAQASFTSFVQTVAHDLRSKRLGTLTVELPPISLFRANIADPAAIGAIADTVVLMTYDYHYSGSYLSGPVAPVGGAPEDREFDVASSIAEAVKKIPKEKILLGVPLYGYQWETIRSAPGSATIPGSASTASSRRVSAFLSNCATCSAGFDETAKEPYITYQEDSYFEQIHYENEEAVKEKVALATSYRLGGIALWALGYEDQSMLTPLSQYKAAFSWDLR